MLYVRTQTDKLRAGLRESASDPSGYGRMGLALHAVTHAYMHTCIHAYMHTYAQVNISFKLIDRPLQLIDGTLWTCISAWCVLTCVCV